MLTVTEKNASVDGKWDPLSGQNMEKRYIKVNAGSKVELQSDGSVKSNIGCLNVVINPNDKLNCNTSCDLDPSSGYHKLHTSGHYTVSGSGGAGEGKKMLWNATGRTTDYDVRLDYMDNEPVKTAQFDVLTPAKLIIEGDLQGKKIKLVGDGVDITDPDKEYTASAEFTFTPNKISAAQDDLSISAVDNEGKCWAKVTLMSYLEYVPAAQACLKQRKDTNAICEKCPEALYPFKLEHLGDRHDGNKAHPDDYEELLKCTHCSFNCGRAVIVTMGLKGHQDEVFDYGTRTLTQNHGRVIVGVLYDDLHMINPDPPLEEYAKRVYEALKNSRGLYGVRTEEGRKEDHAVLLWGMRKNTKAGEITKLGFKYSDPAKPGNFPTKDEGKEFEDEGWSYICKP
mgnify:CR=1 FL=1